MLMKSEKNTQKLEKTHVKPTIEKNHKINLNNSNANRNVCNMNEIHLHKNSM